MKKEYDIDTNKISLIGLGKLGLCLAVCHASKGKKVIGVDIRPDVMSSLNSGNSPIQEPKLQELLSKYSKNLEVTMSHDYAIKNSDISIILVATPSDTYGKFSNRYLESAIKSLCKSLKSSKKSYHLFIISSTLMPGSCVKRLIPLIERTSGRKLNVGFGVSFIPDFVALGEVIKGFIEPDFVLIGESDNKSGGLSEQVYKSMVKNGTPIKRMSLTEAEIAKVSLNAYITTKISFANLISNICDQIPGTDVDKITQTIGIDRRISPYYLTGGPSYGGTCFPRDTKAFAVVCKKLGIKTNLINEVEETNKYQDERLFRLIIKHLQGKKGSVSILGCSFKPNTPVIEESLASKLIPRLIKNKIKVKVYDPLAIQEMKKKFGEKVAYFESPGKCIFGSKVVIISYKKPEFKDSNIYKSLGKNSLILDCWRYLKYEKLNNQVKYKALGMGS